MGDPPKEGHRVFVANVRSEVMKYRMRKSILHGLFVAMLVFCCSGPGFAVVLHPDGEPNLATWTDRPDSNVVGRWSSNASFVVIAPNWVLTTRHQKTVPATVKIDGVSYTCHYNAEWMGGPLGNADIQLVRLTTADGGNPELAHYAGPYTGADEAGQPAVLAGYGDGRGGLLQTDGATYGYDWANSTNTTLRFGTNRIDQTENGSAIGTLISDIIVADFDGLNEGQSAVYESTLAWHDSGGGWFIYDGAEWKVAGLSRAVGVHYEAGHEGDPNYILYQAWFRNRTYPEILEPDYLDGVRVSSYATWILEIINVQADLTGDDWVDFDDVAVFAAYWLSSDCGEPNNWCEGADFEPRDGCVDYHDLGFLLDRWLTGWQY
ncbi:MAG TPA: hypothetical protein VMW16_08445 [Sedimentisphaerales bacterium]|nr:hypothetical protein [Sedimentisphaerales bacterium]